MNLYLNVSFRAGKSLLEVYHALLLADSRLLKRPPFPCSTKLNNETYVPSSYKSPLKQTDGFVAEISVDRSS